MKAWPKRAPATPPSTQPAHPVYEVASQRNVDPTEGLGDCAPPELEPTEFEDSSAEDASRDAEYYILADMLRDIERVSG